MYKSLQTIQEAAEAKGSSFWEVILEDDMKERQITKEASMEQMKKIYLAMKHADATYDKTQRSKSGLVGTDGGKFEDALMQG